MVALASNIVIFFGCLLFGAAFFFIPFFKHRKEYSLKEYTKNNKLKIVISVTFFLIALSRLFLLDLIPAGLNQDEASAGYDAYALMHWGIDRNGMQMPPHLIAWGSGQNSLYSYISIPFIFIFGNNSLALRLPMGLLSLTSIVLLFDLLRRKFGVKEALFGAILLAITPWHFMKSRWSLESNLFPDMVFIAMYFFWMFMLDKKLYKFFISAVILALSSYSYGTSYFFLTFFIGAILIYLLIKKITKWYNLLIYLGIVAIICIPIILFLYVNVFDKEGFRFLFIDIPKLTVNRFSVIEMIKNGTFFSEGIKNWKDLFYILFTQQDGLVFNSVTGFGTIGFLAIPFVIIGLFHKGDKEMTITLKMWLIISILMAFIVSPNINRVNIIFFPLILLSYFGLKDVIKLSGKFNIIIKVSYLAYFVLFSCFYVFDWNNSIKANFNYSFDQAILCASNIEGSTSIYVTNNINMPYIFVLYYTKYDVNDFISTVQYKNSSGAFRYVNSFGNYYFYLPSTVTEGNVYIVSKNNDVYKYQDLSAFKIYDFERYYVIDATI